MTTNHDPRYGSTQGALLPRTPPPRELVAITGALLLVVLAVTAGAQEVRIVGSVQWITASRMQVMTSEGVSVLVDLTDADQSSYRALRTNDWVVVDGTLSSDQRRVMAHTIWRDSGRGDWTQSP